MTDQLGSQAAMQAARNYLLAHGNENGISATDLPEFRIALAESERDRIEQRAWRQDTEPVEQCWEADGFDRPMIEAYKRTAIDVAELYYVAPSMADLAEAAAETVPAFSMREEDFPSRSGLLLFGKALNAFTVIEDVPGCRCGKPHIRTCSGVMWTTAVSKSGKPFALLYLVLDQHLSERMKGKEPRVGLPRLFVATATAIPLFGEADYSHGHDHATNPWIGTMLRTLRTACMLMQQPLARVGHETPDRAAKKRMRRAGQEPKEVRVIELRRPTSTSGGSGSFSEYHHQWIVRGHWRNHWHPKRQVHRPIWIAPHIKGPEGAPLIGGEKVYALKR